MTICYHHFKMAIILSGALICSFNSIIANACTTIFENKSTGAHVVGRSMDLFTTDLPMILAEPRGTKHSGEAGENSLTWEAKYGSVVVTAFHTNGVSDGINEKGLAVHLLYLSKTTYPDNNKKLPQISNTMWAQYILDNFTTVEEALEGTKDLQIVPTKIHDQTWPLHLTMEDQTGDSAIIEFIDGKIHIYHGPQYQVMTNEPSYDIQLSNLKRYKGFGGTLPLPGDPDPLSRFVRAEHFLTTLPTPGNDVEGVAGVLSLMRSVQIPFGAVDTSGNQTVDSWPTRWVSVADVTNKIYFFNSTTTPNIVWIDLNKINFALGSDVLSIDPSDIRLEGDITKSLMPSRS